MYYTISNMHISYLADIIKTIYYYFNAGQRIVDKIVYDTII